jgi:hypothetical protein
MLTAGLIQHSSSPWSAPVCIVSKKDGTPRFCVDFKKINSITTKDAYPLPKPDYTFKALAGSRWYHIVDMETGYWQIKVTLRISIKLLLLPTVGCSNFGLCQWRYPILVHRIERLIENVLGSLNWYKCLLP